MSDLTTLIDVKAWLGIPTGTTTDDTMLSALVTSVSAWIQSYIERQLLTASYTELRSGSGGKALVLNQYPVTAVSALTIDGVAITARTSFGSAGYYLANNTLYLDGGLTFTKGNANISIDYTAGYATAPADIAQAAKQLVALKYRERERIGQVSKSVAGETVSFDIKALPHDVKSILESYNRVSWGT